MVEQWMSHLFDELNGVIEVREITNGGHINKRWFEDLCKLEDYEPPQTKNIYIGMATRKDRSKGEKANCLVTQVLWADFDRMTDVEVREALDNSAMPKPSILVNSGHGVHAYWLLDKPAGIEVEPILRAIVKELGSDPQVAHFAAIMRVPGSTNVKYDPVPCEVLEITSQRYPLEQFRAILGVEDDESDYLIDYAEKTAGRPGIEADRPCVNAILQGVPEGERNFALGRLTKWLQLRGYTSEKAQQVVLQWNTRNSPPEHERKLLKDFHAYWHGDYKLLGCSMKRPELQQILSKYCNRTECKFIEAIGRIELDNVVSYHNRLLSDLDKLTGNDLIVYGLLARHKEGLTTSQLDEKLTVRATGKPCMSKPTRLGSLAKLRRLGFIDVVNGHKAKGLENLYKVRTQGTFGLGYTLVSNGAINGAIDKRITPGEFRLYALLLKYAFTKGSCYPSIRTLGKDLGTTHNNISLRLRGLEQGDYIKRNYRVYNGAEKLFVTLLV